MQKYRFERLFDVMVVVVAAVMALDLRVPAAADTIGFALMWPPVAAYLVTLGNLWLLWTAHRRLCAAMRGAEEALGGTGSALLLGVSMLPFAAASAAQARWTSPAPVVLYGLALAGLWTVFRILRKGAAREAGPDDAAQRAIGASEPGAMVLAAAFGVSAIVALAYPKGGLVLYAAIPIFRVMLRELGSADLRGGPAAGGAPDTPAPSPR